MSLDEESLAFISGIVQAVPIAVHFMGVNAPAKVSIPSEHQKFRTPYNSDESQAELTTRFSSLLYEPLSILTSIHSAIQWREQFVQPYHYTYSNCAA